VAKGGVEAEIEAEIEEANMYRSALLAVLVSLAVCVSGQTQGWVDGFPQGLLPRIDGTPDSMTEFIKNENEGVCANASDKSCGPYEVKAEVQNVTFEGVLSTIFIYTPIATGDPGESTQWPGVVFAHGLCGRVAFYENWLTSLASWGFVVAAVDKFGDCLSNPFENGIGLDYDAFREELIRNLKYVSQREDVNGSKLAIVGHSMGGGTALNIAAELSESDPEFLKAVVVMAPWNGVKPTPSSLVSKIRCPTLIICGEKDGLTPCVGDVQIRFGFAPQLIPFTTVLPSFYPNVGLDWSGGVQSIAGNMSDRAPWILAEAKYVNHFSVADTDGKLSQALQDWVGDRGMKFNDDPLPPGYVIPTVQYTAEFLEASFDLGNVTLYDIFWNPGGIDSDDRFIQPVKRHMID